MLSIPTSNLTPEEDLLWFAERITGYVIRFGPNARRRPDPYIWSVLISDDGKWLVARDGELILPLSETGEFVGVSTKPLNISVVRTALEAGRQLLEGKDPFWRHIKTQEKRMSKYVATLTLASNSTPPSAPAEPFSSFTWHMEDDNDLIDFQEAVSQGLIALGRRRANAANAKAS